MKLKTTLTAGLLALAGIVSAEGIEDPTRQGVFDTFTGKKVAFVPLAMGFDLTEGWAAAMKAQADRLGMEFDIRDPNWSTDAGAQAITALISEKPDVMVVHNPDVQSYARLLRRAEKEGIKVVQVNMKSSFPTDYYIGADWVGIGRAQAEAAVAHCGEGTSKKVQIVQGVLTAAASAYSMHGVQEVLDQHPDITVVSNQAADWDATKARSVTSTVLQQHPDLCASIGFWDVMDTGTAAAVKEAGKDVYIVTSGGGAQMACDNVASGAFGQVISYDVPGQGRDINNAILSLLQNGQDAGASRISLYTPVRKITKDSIGPDTCWSMDTVVR